MVAPPYDVVDPGERAVLAARHSANSILVELPEPDPRTGGDRYEAAAARLAAWTAEGILVRDAVPTFYPYRMTAPDGSVTLGVLGVLGLEPTSARRDPPPRGDPPEGPDRPPRAAGRHPGQPLPHLGSVARPRPDGAAGRVRRPGGHGDRRRRGPPRAVGGRRPGRRGRLADRVGSAPVVVADGHHRLAVASPTWPAPVPAPRGPTVSSPWWSSWPRTCCPWDPSTGSCPGCPTGSTWSTSSPRGSTSPGPATSTTARRPPWASPRRWPW